MPLQTPLGLTTTCDTTRPAHTCICSNCGQPTDPVTIDTLSLSPDPPTKGAILNVTLTGQNAVTTNGGTCVTKVFYLGNPSCDTLP